MAAKLTNMQKLHEMLAEQMLFELQWYRDENIPVPAADKAAISKFLKDNSVTCDPADADDIKRLQEEFAASSKERRERAIAAMKLSDDDIKSQYGVQ